MRNTGSMLLCAVGRVCSNNLRKFFMRDFFMRKMGVALFLMLSAGLALAPAAAASCESLAKLALPDGKITSAQMVAAGAFTPPGGGGPLTGGPGGMSAFKNTPAFCRVTATLTPTTDSDIKIEVWMPATGWNGKLVGIGNGVWAGNIAYTSLAEPLARGYATAATDAGHVGNGMDAKFAVGHPEKLVDFGYRAVHEMTVKAKMLLKAYYDRQPQRSLWVSCSTGGRQGLMEGYRYPEDYDGISSMAPANPMSGLMLDTLWTGYAAMKTPERRLPFPKITLAHQAAIRHCDEKDGLKDGIIGDPEKCDFNPATLRCKDGNTDGADCLTAGQVAALEDIYAGVKNPRTGELIFAGFAPGSEQQFMMLVTGNEPFPVATSFFRDVVFADPQWDFKTFDYDKDLAPAYKYGREMLDVPADGLNSFLARGGKLLLSHGWADGLIPSENSINLYQAMTKGMDAKKAAAVRLFMLPGVGHCGGGSASVTDMLGVLDEWVESGKAPEQIIATSPAGQKTMSRPICSWPRVARYKGSGNPDDAASFVCK